MGEGDPLVALGRVVIADLGNVHLALFSGVGARVHKERGALVDLVEAELCDMKRTVPAVRIGIKFVAVRIKVLGFLEVFQNVRVPLLQRKPLALSFV